MKILKITTHWTPEEADCVYQLLDDLKEAIWQSYGEDIVHLYQTIHEEQQADFEYALHYLVTQRLDLSIFAEAYKAGPLMILLSC